ncbi:MAG: hypothetical protein IPM74_12190 [Crocinitomicaceae bacterium]|nr:hypothetical protein [Crocinitomicaceae bacterium]MBK8926634.1 hypothetical protein [Crocinitomicaceae bacterium]
MSDKKSKYYVNVKTESDGSHQMHTTYCAFRPSAESNRIEVGKFSSCNEALIKAHAIFDLVRACHFCCHACSELNAKNKLTQNGDYLNGTKK